MPEPTKVFVQLVGLFGVIGWVVACSDELVAPVPTPAPTGTTVLAIGDTVSGPVGTSSFSLWLEPGDTVDIRFRGGGLSQCCLFYRRYYTASVYGSDGGLYGTQWDEQALYRLAFRGIWPRVASSDAGWLTIIVGVAGDSRGPLENGYVLATRRSGPILRAYVVSDPNYSMSGPWDKLVQDTIWAWNAGTGSATLSAFSDDEKVSFQPDGGLLPVVAVPPANYRPPPGAVPVIVTVVDPALGARAQLTVELKVDGDDWGGSHTQTYAVHLYDPRISVLFRDEETSFRDVAVYPDGSVVLVYQDHASPPGSGLLKLDPNTGTTTEIPTSLRLGWFSRLDVGPDGSLYVRDEDQALWRLDPDGSEEKLNVPGNLGDVAVGPEGSIFLAANWRGLWVLDAGGSLSLLTETACSAIAYDPTGDKVYCASRYDDLFVFDRKTGATTSLERPPELSGPIEDIDVGRSGKLYGVGDLWHEDVIFEFDPLTESWSEVALGPRFLRNLVVSEDRLLALSRAGLVAMPVDDGPPVIPVSRDPQP